MASGSAVMSVNEQKYLTTSIFCALALVSLMTSESLAYPQSSLVMRPEDDPRISVALPSTTTTTTMGPPRPHGSDDDVQKIPGESDALTGVTSSHDGVKTGDNSKNGGGGGGRGKAKRRKRPLADLHADAKGGLKWMNALKQVSNGSVFAPTEGFSLVCGK